jgi:phage baseplate assembly protein W
MTDSYHFWGNDTQFSASADDLQVDGPLELEQRILRGLLTNPLDDPFNPTYGAGLGRHIGQPLTPERYGEIQSDILSVVLREPDVQKLPAPVVTLQADQAGGFDSATLNYVYAPTGQPRTITAP